MKSKCDYRRSYSIFRWTWKGAGRREEKQQKTSSYYLYPQGVCSIPCCLVLAFPHWYMVLGASGLVSSPSTYSGGDSANNKQPAVTYCGCLGLPRRLHILGASAPTHIQQEAEHNPGAGIQAGRDMLQTPTVVETLSEVSSFPLQDMYCGF